MASGLDGIQVVEIAGGVAGAYAAKLVADLGASVIKVEPPAGDPSRRRGPFRDGVPDPEASGEFLALNPNKRSVVLDLETPAGREQLRALAARAHLLIHSFSPRQMEARGVDYARLSQDNPALVLLSLTPYGLTGPYRDYVASDLTLYHGSAASSVMADPRDPALAPVKFFGPYTGIQAALHGVTAALACCLDAQRSGVGEHIDASQYDLNSSYPLPFFFEWSYGKKLPDRQSPLFFAPAQFYPCRDGFLFITTPQEHQWKNLVKVMGSPGWCDDPRFATGADRLANRDALNEHLTAWTREWTTDDLFAACQDGGVAAVPLYRPSRIMQHPHLLERGFLREVNHPVAGKLTLPGPPWLLREPWWALRTPPPLLGEANGEAATLFKPLERPAAPSAPALPLSGVRVLDMTWVWAGPHCTEMLAFLGAEVLKIESTKHPDVVRQIGPLPQGTDPGLNRRALFNQYNQGKQSLAVDVTHPDGLALIHRLAKVSHVTASNFSYGVMDRFGLSAEEFHKINPELIVLMISGFGQSGPLKEYIAYGQTVFPLSAMIPLPSEEGQQPQYPAGSGDPNAGIYGAFAIIAALMARQLHGRSGQFIDSSLWENMIPNSFMAWMNEALGNGPMEFMANRDMQWAPHNLYPCAGTDQWIAIAVETEAAWQGLCRAMGQPALADKPDFATMAARKEHEDALDDLIAKWTARQDRWVLTDKLQAEGVAAFPALTARDLTENPHLNERGFFWRVEHPEVGAQTHIGVPWHTMRRPTFPPQCSPLLGAHTDSALQRVLGMDTAELDDLRQRGVIG